MVCDDLRRACLRDPENEELRRAYRASLSLTGPHFAVVSGIHGNLEALRAVLDHSDSLGIEEIICLGDVAGYGPSPKACLDLARQRFQVCLRGPDDEHWLFRRRSVTWAQDCCFIESRSFFHERYGHLFTFDLASEARSLDCRFLGMGSLEAVFSQFSKVCFMGRQASVISDRGLILQPEDFASVFHLEGTGAKFIFNVGAVGQPTGADRRATYVEVYGDTVFYHRVDYDIADTCRRIREQPAMYRDFAARWLQGFAPLRHKAS